MGFNLTIFVAQLINFFLLIWLLKRFLYRPILEIIEKRRQQIAQDITEAEKKLATASVLETQLQQQQELFEKQKKQRFHQLDIELKQSKEQQLQELRQEQRKSQEKLQQDLERAWFSSEEKIKALLETEFMQLSQKVLTEWSEQNSMDMVLTLFHQKLSRLSKKNIATINLIIKGNPTILVTSTKALSLSQKEMLQNALNQRLTLPPKIKWQFKVQSRLILGLEIRFGTYLLSWNLQAYLEEIIQHVHQAVPTLIRPQQRKGSK